MGKRRGHHPLFLSLLHPSTLRDGDNVLKERNKERKNERRKKKPLEFPQPLFRATGSLRLVPYFLSRRRRVAARREQSSHNIFFVFFLSTLSPLLLFLEGDAKRL
jgi:hypothetical protein